MFLEQSHIYVGIFGKSYGQIDPDIEGFMMEDEYEDAKVISRKSRQFCEAVLI